MKAFLCFLFLLLSALRAQAEGFNFQVFFFNPEIRYERSQDQETVQRKPHSYSVAVRRDLFSGLFEYSNFSDESGNSTLSIDREHRDYLLWGRMHFYNLKEDYIDFSLYMGLGAGVYQESVDTTLNGITTKDNGGTEIETGAVLGADSVLEIQNDFGLMLGAELRLLFGRDFDPNPEASGLLRVGFQF